MSTTLWYPTSTMDEDLFALPWRPPQTASIPKERRSQKALIAALATASIFSGVSGLTSTGDISAHPFAIRMTSLDSYAETTLSTSARSPLSDFEPAQAVSRRGNIIEGAIVLAAVSDLQHWLGLNKSQVARVGQFNRRSLINWERQGAYRSTVRHLLGVHALVRAVVDSLGQQSALTWFAAQAAAQGDSRTLDALLGDGAAVNQLARAAGSFIFETLESPSQFADLEFDETRPPQTSVGATRPKRKPVLAQRPSRKE